MIQLTLPIRLGLALAGGVAAGFAFPEPGIAALAPVGVALVTVACWRAPARQALLVGYLSGSPSTCCCCRGCAWWEWMRG